MSGRNNILICTRRIKYWWTCKQWTGQTSNLIQLDRFESRPGCDLPCYESSRLHQLGRSSPFRRPSTRFSFRVGLSHPSFLLRGGSQTYSSGMAREFNPNRRPKWSTSRRDCAWSRRIPQDRVGFQQLAGGAGGLQVSILIPFFFRLENLDGAIEYLLVTR